jgi:hypothetical protein
MPRHILVLGSTSPAGQAFCLSALRDSHTLTLYVRNASKLPAEISANSTVLTGQLDDAHALEEAISCGAKTCISFLGPVLNAQSAGPVRRGELPLTRGYSLIVPLLRKHQYERFLAVSTASYAVPYDKFSLLYALMVWSVYLLFRTAYDEINGFTPLITNLPVEEVKWTVFRVPLLLHGEVRDVKVGYAGDVGASLNREALAEWVLREMGEERWVGKCPAIGNV